LQARRDRVILITGDHDVLLSRSIAHQDAPKRFEELEYGPTRRRIYATAGTVVSFSGADQGEAAGRLAQAIHDLDQDSS